MYDRFPQRDVRLLNQWKKTIAPHTLHTNFVSGLICINHFSESVLTKSNDLKKGALPTIFNDQFECSNFTTSSSCSSPSKTIESTNGQQENPNEFSNEDFQVRYDELLKEHFKQQVDHGVQITNFEKKVFDLKESLKTKNDQIVSLHKQIDRLQKSKESLQNNVKELQQTTSISQKALDVLQVFFFGNCNHCIYIPFLIVNPVRFHKDRFSSNHQSSQSFLFHL